MTRPWAGFHNQSIADCISLQNYAKCDKFANLLLNDALYVTATRRGNPDNYSFINAVLSRWYNSRDDTAVPCTWADLIRCMKQAEMNPQMIEIIERNV